MFIIEDYISLKFGTNTFVVEDDIYFRVYARVSKVPFYRKTV